MYLLWFLGSLSFLVSVSNSDDTYCVYICTGRYAYAYHGKENCKGLQKCKGEIIIVTLQRAKEMKRRPCGFCKGRPFKCTIPGKIGFRNIFLKCNVSSLQRYEILFSPLFRFYDTIPQE